MGYIKLEDVDSNELEHGIKLALGNAREMINEGDLLYDNNCFARAYTLYQLACEEVGKGLLLFNLLTDLKLGHTPNYREINKEFTHHEVKSKNATVFEKLVLLLMNGNAQGSVKERKKKFFTELEALEVGNNVAELNNNKNDSLYVGLQHAKFVSPKDVISKEMAQKIRINAFVRLNAGESLLEMFVADLDGLIQGIKNFNHSGKQIDMDDIDLFF